MPLSETPPGRPAPPRSVGDPLSRTLSRSVAFAILAGAALGALEALRWLALDPPRYAGWAARLALLSIAGDALLAMLLALPCALLARLLWRPAEHRAAPASACAGLGVALGLALWIGPLGPGLRALIAAALGATLVCLALRELLAWWPLPTRRKPWAWLLVLACVAVTALLAARLRPAPETDAQKGATNVLLVSIDTLRADHLGCYGSENARTPVADLLAVEGVLFQDATSQANTTGPSHATMLTGLHPFEHGAIENGVPLWRRASTLADALGGSGYRTAAFVSGFTLVDQACGFAGRFQRYDDDLLAWSALAPGCERLRLFETASDLAERCGVRVLRGDRPASETVDRALEWLERGSADRPFFLFVHLYDPHAPYEPPPEFAELHDPGYQSERSFGWYALDSEERRALVADPRARAHMEALYRAEISYADAQVGRLVAALEQRGELERTLVVLTSDHGEGLGAHGYYFDHGTFLYDEELSVPLILRLPGRLPAGARVGAQARVVDLAPTILGLLDQEPLLACTGSSLLPLIDSAPAAPPRPSFALSELAGDVSGFGVEGRRLSLRAGGRKLIWSSEHWLDTQRVPPRLEAYDLESDPGELVDLLVSPGGALPPAFEPMRAELEAFRTAGEQVRAGAEPSAEVLERLRLLGY